MVWISIGNSPQRLLERRVFADVDDQFLNDQFNVFSDPSVPNIAETVVTTSTITNVCLHFGVWLMGTADLRQPNDTNRIYERPSNNDPFWTQADPVVDASWYPDDQIYTTMPSPAGNNGWTKASCNTPPPFALP